MTPIDWFKVVLIALMPAPTNEPAVAEDVPAAYCVERQVPFVLAPPVKIAGEKRARPALRYTADAAYGEVKSGKYVVEDCKGVPVRAV